MNRMASQKLGITNIAKRNGKRSKTECFSNKKIKKNPPGQRVKGGDTLEYSWSVEAVAWCPSVMVAYCGISCRKAFLVSFWVLTKIRRVYRPKKSLHLRA